MHSIRFFSQIIRLYRARMTAVLSMQLLAAVAEAFGVATLLPLLLLVTGPTTGSQSVVVRSMAAGLATVGLPFSLPVLLVVLVVAVSIKTIFTFIAWRQIGAATAAVAADMRYRLLLAISRARWAYFVDQPIGSLSNAVGGQTMRAAGAFMLVCEVIAQGLQLLVYIGLAVLVTPWYVVTGAGVIAAILFVSMRRVRDARRDAEVRETVALDQLTIRITDGLRSFKTLKAMGVEESFVDLLKHEAKEIDQAQRATAVTMAIVRSASEPLVAIFLAIGIYFAVEYWHVSITELLFMGVLFSRTVGRATALQALLHNLIGKEVVVAAMEDVIEGAHAQRDEQKGGKIVEMDGPIVLDNVTFHYGDVTVLDGVNAELPPGKLIIIRGPSGAGKTTLIDLLIGFHQPSSGAIRVHGTPLAEMDLHHWRSQLGYVPQDSTMLQDSIADNISLRRSDVAAADVVTALKRAEAWPFVSVMPNGVDSMIGENGARLSGGQKQRLAIARALVHKPKLLILDEPTSALDAATALELVQTLRALATQDNVAVLAVTHHDLLAQKADILFDVRNGQLRLVSRDEIAALAS